MMKKKGFTLAEVLITLTIIGVVAVLTLPSLMANVAEAQAKTAFKKMVNTLSNAASLSDANVGLNFSNMDTVSTLSDSTTLNADINGTANAHLTTSNTFERLIVDNTKYDGTKKATCKSTLSGGTLRAIYFEDGTSIIIDTTKSISHDITSGTGEDKGGGIFAILDTNGDKGPNQISNCVPTNGGITAVSGDDSGNCTQKKNRYIKDQFLVKLRGTTVKPLGAASAYMLLDTTGAPESGSDITSTYNPSGTGTGS